MINARLGAAGVVLAACCLAAGGANASPVSAGQNVYITPGDASRFYYSHDGQTSSGGAFYLHNDSDPGMTPFITFCLERGELLEFSAPPGDIRAYRVDTITDGARSGGKSGGVLIGGIMSDPLDLRTKYVYDRFRSGATWGAASTNEVAEFVQEVIWYIEGEIPEPGGSHTLRPKAQDILNDAIANAATHDFGTRSVSVLNLQVWDPALNGVGGWKPAQDLIYRDSVPEPATLLLLAAGMAGLFARARRRT